MVSGLSDPPATERWSAALWDRYERLAERHAFLGLAEPAEPPAALGASPERPSPFFGTEIFARPVQIAAEPRLIAEFEGVLALYRKRPNDRTLSIVPWGTVLRPMARFRAAYRDRANLAWVTFGEIVLSAKTGRPALQALGLAPLPGAAHGGLPGAQPFRGIGPEILRAVSATELVDHVIQALVRREQWTTALEASGLHWPLGDEKSRDALARFATVLPPTRGRPVKAEHYQRIAVRVRQLEEAGQLRGLGAVIADEEGVPESTAYRWIRKARIMAADGLLPIPSEPTIIEGES